MASSVAEPFSAVYSDFNNALPLIAQDSLKSY